MSKIKDYLEEGDFCPKPNCEGKMGFHPVENCACHTNPPCGKCITNPLVCLKCGYTEDDGVLLGAFLNLRK